MGRPKIRITNSVRERRKEMGITQQALADEIGVTRQTVNAIEGEKYSPSIEVAFMIAQTLDATVDEVFAVEQG